MNGFGGSTSESHTLSKRTSIPRSHFARATSRITHGSTRTQSQTNPENPIMREVNLVDYAPWLRRGLIGCIVQALVFIGLSAVQTGHYMIRNDQKSDVPCGTMSPMHLYILAGTQTLAEVYCGWPEFHTVFRFLTAGFALIGCSYLTYKLDQQHAYSIKIFTAFMLFCTCICMIGDSIAVQKSRNLAQGSQSMAYYFGTFVFVCVWDAVYVAVTGFTFYAAYHWHRVLQSSGPRAPDVEPAYEAPKVPLGESLLLPAEVAVTVDAAPIVIPIASADIL